MIKKIILSLFLSLFFLPTIGMTKSAWHLSKKEDGISVYVKNNIGSPVKSFKGSMIIRSKLASIVTLLDDTKAYPSLLHNCKSAKNLKTVNRFESYRYIVTSMPWPVANRDMIVHSVMRQNKQSKQIDIQLAAETGLVPLNAKMVRIKTMKGSWLLTPLVVGNNKRKIKIEYEMNLDPGGKIPKWLANSLAVDFPFYTLSRLRQLVAKPNYQNVSLPYILE